ncbi:MULTISPECIES: alpha/beta fold hydrolase [unclassified Roseovarius]|uniref:alpha/beta fold hydrolase n=1 Tax=unclassified Roseovarius TaxID=2614913 RepID=UPI00274008EE|nr:alpha/beta fold hydrolase [Roseovarius sp. MMSF_3350]
MEDIIALLMALTAPEPDGRYFETLLARGEGAPVEIVSCRDPMAMSEIVGETILCGTVTVPEDHDAPENGQSVDLAFAILRSETTYPAPDPLVYLHGGPGIGNLNSGLSFMADAFAPFRANRDVIIFDQRAAGISSGSVVCYEQIAQNVSQVITEETGALEADPEGNPVVSQFLKDCLSEIEADGTDLSKYNTRQNALDVPMILTALGYEEWNLYGISYGTKLTLEVLRTAPEGVRSAVIDGVAPPWVRLYDTLTLPLAESMQRLVEDCAADMVCDMAYPDLGEVLRDVIARSKAGDLVVDGATIPPQLVLNFFSQRNDRFNLGSLTPYIPAMVYELHRGDDTPTIEMVVKDWDFSVPQPDADAVLAARRDDLTEQQMHLLQMALGDAAIIDDATTALGIAVADLRRQLRRDRVLGPMPGLFDAELSAAVPDTIVTSDAARATLEGYSALQLGAPTRERLSMFVETHFEGPHLARLLAIVEAMTDEEIAAVYADAAQSVQTHTLEFQQNSIDLMLYACQEDMPYNTMEGYRQTSAEQPFDVTAFFDGAAAGVYTVCTAFTPTQRENWHEVVESDIPTVSIGSGWDTQTAASWAKEATRGLTNAQHFFIAEAGHGALAYVDCVGDMTAAFVNDPTRTLDNSCVEATAVPAFHIAPRVDTAQ